MVVAELLDPQANEQELNLAAAPGGKATYLAAMMKSQGSLITKEIHHRRAWKSADNSKRCGVRNASILNLSPERLIKKF